MKDVATYFLKKVASPRYVLVEGMRMDYRFVKAYHVQTRETVLLLTGFGSGWEGITETACAFVDKGVNVILVSLPGYGSSDNLKKELLLKIKKEKSFVVEGDLMCQFVTQVIKRNDITMADIHLVGHSMGATILAEMQKLLPQKAQSLQMVAPACFYKDTWTLPLRFIWCGFLMRLKCRAEYQRLYGVLQKQKSCWTRGRIRQRLQEVRRLKNQSLAMTVFSNEKTRIIAGSKDCVYPPDKFVLPEIRVCIVPEFYHNPTIPHARELADLILEEIEK